MYHVVWHQCSGVAGQSCAQSGGCQPWYIRHTWRVLNKTQTPWPHPIDSLGSPLGIGICQYSPDNFNVQSGLRMAALDTHPWHSTTVLARHPSSHFVSSPEGRNVICSPSYPHGQCKCCEHWRGATAAICHTVCFLSALSCRLCRCS